MTSIYLYYLHLLDIYKKVDIVKTICLKIDKSVGGFILNKLYRELLLFFSSLYIDTSIQIKIVKNQTIVYIFCTMGINLFK